MEEPNSSKATVRDFLEWGGEERIEIINGVICVLNTPTPLHQFISREIAKYLNSYFEGKKCEPLYAPLGVQLFEDDDTTVVQPDILIVCDRDKIKKDLIMGAPDVVIEIISPSTAERDRGNKYHLYNDSGVREYWLVDTLFKCVEVFDRSKTSNLAPGKYYSKDKVLTTNLFKGLGIPLNEIFLDEFYKGLVY